MSGPGAVLEWTFEPLGLSGKVPVAPTGANRAFAVPGIEIVVPELAIALAATLRLTLRDAKGGVIVRNYEALSV